MKKPPMDKPLIIDDDLEEFENEMPLLPDSEQEVTDDFEVESDD